MGNPYLIAPPALISFSGGRTSGYMLRQILDAHGGGLPSGLHVVFANTGKERPETLDFVRDCAAAWGVNIRWVEWLADAPGWCEASYESACREGEPFAALIAKKGGYLPNGRQRFCTSLLKLAPIDAFMAAAGHGEPDQWRNVVGLRADEPTRVAKRRADDSHDSVMPLATAGVRKADVLAFWARQSFDLHLAPWEGNCDLCFLKGRAIRLRIMRDRPDLVDWWAEQEQLTGNQFVNPTRELGYADQLAIVRRLPMLPGFEDEEEMGCACHD